MIKKLKTVTKNYKPAIKSDIKRVIARVESLPRYKKLTEKFWTKDCDKKLKKLCKEYGIFAGFFFNFKETIGKKKYERLLKKLEALAEKDDSNWGFGMSISIVPPDKENGKNKIVCQMHEPVRPDTFPYSFVGYKNYGMTTKIPNSNSRCKLCRKKIFFKRYNNADMGMAKYIIEKDFKIKIKSIKDFCICSKCVNEFLNTRRWETRMKMNKRQALKILKRLYVLLGFIPPRDFSLRLIRITPKKQIQKVFSIIKKIPPEYYFKEKCGSWFNVLVQSGILKEGTRKLSRGTMCKAKDGHTCLSMAELTVDNWLSSHKIKHTKEPRYPADKELNPNGLMRADWKVGKNYVEFFGLEGEKDYDIKIELKKELCKKSNLNLIAIYHEDLKNLDMKLRHIKKSKKHRKL